MRYRVEDVTKVYGGTVLANDGISLDVRAGEIFGLLGPNGAGKSTLVQQLVGLLRPDKGAIHYEDCPVTPGSTWVKRCVAYLAQRPLALLDLTAWEAIVYTGRLRGLSRDRAEREADELVEELGLVDCADRLVARLSGGQHRLVGLGSALIGDAETLVLDEPTNELDPEMRRRVWASLEDRCRNRGTTVVLVTHNALEAEGVIERLAVLVAGRVVASGTPGEIKARIDPRIRVELRFRGGVAGARGRLEEIGEVVRNAPNLLVLAVPRSAAGRVLADVLELVPLEELDDFRVLTPTLEDVYLQVAARETAVEVTR